LNIDRDTARTAVDRLEQHDLDKTTAEQVLSTAIVVVYLETMMADEEGTWELVVEKAWDWLEEGVEGEDVFKEAWKMAKELVGI
jgi:hypothetical protein